MSVGKDEMFNNILREKDFSNRDCRSLERDREIMTYSTVQLVTLGKLTNKAKFRVLPPRQKIPFPTFHVTLQSPPLE